MARYSGRKKITWKAGAGPEPKLQVMPTLGDYQAFPHFYEEVVSRLQPGNLFRLRADHSIFTVSSQFIQPPYPYLVTVFGPAATTKGEIAVHTETLRVEERDTGIRGIRRYVRHVFLIKGTRYIIPDVTRLEAL